MALDKETLLASAELPEADVEVSGKGTVRVRGLTRAEVQGINKSVKSEADAIKRQSEIERQMIATAMVEPVLSIADVGRWQKTSVAGEIRPVERKIQELSGMLEGAEKEAYQEFEQDSEAEFRLPPS